MALGVASVSLAIIIGTSSEIQDRLFNDSDNNTPNISDVVSVTLNNETVLDTLDSLESLDNEISTGNVDTIQEIAESETKEIESDIVSDILQDDVVTQIKDMSVDPIEAYNKIKEYLANLTNEDRQDIEPISEAYLMPKDYTLQDVLKLISDLKANNPEFAEYLDKVNNEKINDEKQDEVVLDENHINLTSNTNTRDYTYEKGKINANNAKGFELSDELQKEIFDLIKSDPRKTGFYLTDPKTNATISYNEDFTIHPASSIKAGVALCATKMIDRGEMNFDDKVVYQPKHYVEGSGIIQNEKFGKEYTIKDLIHLSINISDNVAYYMLLDAVGHDNYNAMVQDLGLSYDLGQSYKFNYITPRDLNLIWQEIYAYKDYSEAGQYLFDELLDAKFNYYKTAFPQLNSAHKSGFNAKGYHDSAVVYCAGENNEDPYIFTILTEPLNGRESSSSDSKNFTKYAKVLMKCVNEYEAYKEANPELFNEVDNEKNIVDKDTDSMEK